MSKALEAGFDHPCRETCSGWKQGKERGVFETEKKIAPLIEALQGIERKMIFARDNFDSERDSMKVGLRVLEALGEAREALDKFRGKK